MEERYKNTTILVTTTASLKGSRWKSSCTVKYLKDKQEELQDLKLDIDYDTAEQAKRAGLVFAKKWVDAKL
jgi:hypothetical protein